MVMKSTDAANANRWFGLYVVQRLGESLLTHQGLLRLITPVPADRISGTSVCKTPGLSSSNEVAQEECGRPPVI